MFRACFCSCINIHEGDDAANHVPPTQRVYCYVTHNEALHAPACVACVTYCVMENYHTPRPLAAFILFRVRCADGFSKLIIVISAVAAVVAVSMIRSCVRPSVCLSHHAAAATACGRFAAERHAGDRYRSTAAAPSRGGAARHSAANASSVTFTANVGS